jgi:DNA-directed RNA polymerase specialized sigma subunit
MNLAIQTGREEAVKEMGRKGAINRHLYERKDGLDERDRKIVEECKSGMLPKSIAKKFDLSVSQVRRILKKPI